MTAPVDAPPLPPAGDRRPSAPAGLARWWTGLGTGQRALVAAVALVVVANGALAGLRSVTGGSPGGPTSSSFATKGSGLRAYAALLARDGHDVVRLRSHVTTADLPTGATAVLADPSVLTTAEARALAAFVDRGGRLVLAGEGTEPLVEALTGRSPGWEEGDAVDRLAVWLPVDGTGSARRLAGDQGGRWREPGGLVPVAGADGGAAVLVGPLGRGRLLAVADSSLLQNDHLDQADNAAFGLGLAGPSTRRVVFVESAHGFSGGGWAAVPSGWKWAGLGLLVLVVPAALWSAGARFGPPEPARRQLRPPRLDHVQAVAADLDRVSASPADAAAPLLATTRAALADHLGVAADASPAVLFAAADRRGVDHAEVDILLRPAPDLGAALQIGAVAARRQRTRHGLADAAPADPDPTTSPGAPT